MSETHHSTNLLLTEILDLLAKQETMHIRQLERQREHASTTNRPSLIGHVRPAVRRREVK